MSILSFSEISEQKHETLVAKNMLDFTSRNIKLSPQILLVCQPGLWLNSTTCDNLSSKGLFSLHIIHLWFLQEIFLQENLHLNWLKLPLCGSAEKVEDQNNFLDSVSTVHQPNGYYDNWPWITNPSSIQSIHYRQVG